MRKELLPNEQVIVSTRPQPRALFWPVLVFVVVPATAAFASAWLSRGRLHQAFAWADPLWDPWLMLACGAAAVWVILFYSLPRVLRWNSTRYILTSLRIVEKRSMLGRKDRQYSLSTVRDISVQQTLLQRILHSGNITLDSGHFGSSAFVDVPEVIKFRNLLLEAMRELPKTELYRGNPGQDDELRDFSDPSLPWELREGESDGR
ncbi:PH domain-containing protein [Pseudarthrobacter sp. J1738]|uniref:PH domain-containing protein n=1 Tax=Pseudarthrobacter sp. J1738 TaxID=3420446 RepID=UPI003D2A330B